MFACWFVCLSVCLPQGGVEQYEGVAESVRTTRWLLIRSPSLFHTSTADRGWVTVGESTSHQLALSLSLAMRQRLAMKRLQTVEQIMYLREVLILTVVILQRHTSLSDEIYKNCNT